MTKTIIKKIIIGILILAIGWVCFRVAVITYSLYQDGWRLGDWRDIIRDTADYIKYRMNEPKEEITEVELTKNCQPEIDIEEEIPEHQPNTPRELPYNKYQLKEQAEEYLQTQAGKALEKLRTMENLRFYEDYSDAGYWASWRESMETPSVLEIGISSITGKIIYFKNCFKVSAK